MSKPVEPKAALNIWVPESLKAAIDKLAEGERRSTTQQVIIALEEHLKQEEHA